MPGEPVVHEHVIPAEALLAAMEMVRALRGNERVPAEEIAEVVERLGYREFYHAFGAFVGGWLQFVEDPMIVVPALVRRLRRLGVSEDVLPMVAGAVTAAAVGRARASGGSNSAPSSYLSLPPGPSRPPRWPTSSTSTTGRAPCPAGWTRSSIGCWPADVRFARQLPTTCSADWWRSDSGLLAVSRLRPGDDGERRGDAWHRLSSRRHRQGGTEDARGPLRPGC